MARYLENFLNENNFKYDRKLAYGVYRARFLTVKFKTTIVKVTISFNQQVGKETGRSVSNKISEIKMAYNCILNAITTNIHIELFLYQSNDLNDNFQAILDKIFDILDTYKLKTREICPLCGQDLTPSDPLVRIGDSIFNAHQKCVDGLINASQAFEGTINKKPMKTTLLTILSGVISLGIVLALCVILAKTSLIGGAMILSASLSLIISRYFAFKFKLIRDSKQLIIRSIIAFIALLLCVFLGTLLIYYQAYGPIGISEYFTYFSKTFSDGILDSKNRIYDIATGLILMAFTIITEVMLLKSQRKEIYIIK